MAIQTCMGTDFTQHALFITVIPLTTSHNVHMPTLGNGSALFLWVLVDLISICFSWKTQLLYISGLVPKNKFLWFLCHLQRRVNLRHYFSVAYHFQFSTFFSVLIASFIIFACGCVHAPVLYQSKRQSKNVDV